MLINLSQQIKDRRGMILTINAKTPQTSLGDLLYYAMTADTREPASPTTIDGKRTAIRVINKIASVGEVEFSQDEIDMLLTHSAAALPTLAYEAIENALCVKES